MQNNLPVIKCIVFGKDSPMLDILKASCQQL